MLVDEPHACPAAYALYSAVHPRPHQRLTPDLISMPRSAANRYLVPIMGHNRAGRGRLNSLLADFRAFVVELATDASKPRDGRNSFIPFPPHMFSMNEYGTVLLSKEEGRRFSTIIAGIGEAMGDAMSEASLRKLLQTAILKTLDPKGKHHGQSLEVRAKRAVDEVSATLSSPHLRWTNCIPLIGMTPPKKAWVLNDVTLIDIARREGKALLRAADSVTDGTTNTKEEKSAAKAELRKHLIDEHSGGAFALVTTSALDAEAAWASAQRRLRFKLDCLNFALGVIHPRDRYRLTFTAPPHRHFTCGLTINATDRTSTRVHYDLDTPIENAERLRTSIRKTPALHKLFEYLASPNPTGHQNRVLSAVQWAGRASAAARPEEAFLFRAIALESLILGGNDKSDLSMRLRYSIVHLLGGQVLSRAGSARDLRDLYGVRSQIVHSGIYEVERESSTLMREYVNRCFTRILSGRHFTKMAGSGDLDDWFTARLVGDDTGG